MKTDLDRWVDSLEREWQKERSRELLVLLREVFPEAVEALKWSSPAFDQKGPLVWFFCAKGWIHLAFPNGALLDVPEGTWIEGPDTTSKGKRTLRLLPGETWDASLVRDLARQALANNLAGQKVDFRIPRPGSAPFDLPEVWHDFLVDHGKLDLYLARADYQQRGWIRWIEGARTQATRDKRAAAMLGELDAGLYMPPKGRIKPGESSSRPVS